jgi:hypothetical protein
MLLRVKSCNGKEWISKLYKVSPRIILRRLEFVRNYSHSKEVPHATQELIDHILRFSTSFESVSARISSRESERARCCCLVC